MRVWYARKGPPAPPYAGALPPVSAFRLAQMDIVHLSVYSVALSRIANNAKATVAAVGCTTDRV